MIRYTRFFSVNIYSLVPYVNLENDELFPIFRIVDKAIKDHVNRDRKNGFTGPAFIPSEVRHCLKSKLPTLQEVAIPDDTLALIPDVVEQGTSRSVPDPSISSKLISKHTTKHITTSDTSLKMSVIK